MYRLEKSLKWTGPAVAILLVLVMATLAVCVTMAYAGRSEKPDNVLTYEKGVLVWDSAVRIDPEMGEYELPLFDGMREGRDGEKIIAPGDGDSRILRLSNKAGGEVGYVAALYLKTEKDIPIEGDFTNSDRPKEDVSFALPEPIKDSRILDLASGNLGKGQIQDFDIQWLWAFESGRDAEDTLLGTDGGTAKLGVYITVVREDVNIDTDGDGILDGNIDTDGDGEPDINIDTDGDGKPDINIDTDGDGKPDINIDTDGDGKPDINIDTDGDGIADINIDIDGDGRADLNIDTDGDGIPDLNVDEDGDGLVDIAVQPQAPTTGDGSPLYLAIVILAAAVAAFGFLLGRRRGRWLWVK